MWKGRLELNGLGIKFKEKKRKNGLVVRDYIDFTNPNEDIGPKVVSHEAQVRDEN